MNNDLEKKLFDSYPKLLTSLASFEVDDGWYDLIDYLLEELTPFDITIAQIKSKFGGLRVYYDINENLSDKDLHKVNNIIREYESGSITVCETCGKKGGRKSCHNWLMTLCDEHYNEWMREHSAR